MGATGLKSPEEERTDERLNPGAQRQADRTDRFGQPDREKTNLSGQEKDDFNDIARNNGDLGDLKSAEDNPGTPSDSGNTGDPAASEDSPWRTSLQADGDKGGGKKSGVQDQYKKYKKWAAIGTAISTLIFGGFAAFFGLMNFAVINFKEVNYESSMKRSYTKSAQRAAKTKAAQWFSDPEDCKGIRCRYKSGVDQRQLDKFRRMGIVADVTPTNVPKPGSFKLNSLTLPDGTVLDSKEKMAEEFKRNKKVRSMVASAAETKGSFTRTKAMLRKMKALAMSRKKVTPTSKEDLEKEIRQRTAGVDSDGVSLRATNPADPDADATVNEDVDGLSEEIEREAAEQRERWLNDPDYDPEHQASLPDAERLAAGGIAKSIKYGGRLDGVLQGACTAYTILKAVDIGAKVLLAAQLMRYAQTLMSFADAIKAGEATAQEVSLVANLLFSTDDEGRNFFDSPGYQYISYGTPPKQSEISHLIVGASFALTVSKARNFIDNALPGNSASATCRIVQSYAFQGAALVASGAAAFFSAGTSVLGTLAIGAATSVVLGVLEAYAVPLLISMAAGTAVDPENGYELGSAVAAGMFAFSDSLSRSQGLRPMKEGEIAANQTEMNRLYNDFFPDDKPTLTDKVLTNMAMFSMQSFTSVSSLLQPQQLFAHAGANHSIASVYATDAIAPGSACKDPDYEGLATTDFCTLIYSQSTATIESPQYAPEVTQAYMLDNGHVSEDSGEPLSDEYKDFVAICMDGTVPLVDTSVAGAEAAGDSVRDYCASTTEQKAHFRMFRMDTNLTEDPDAVTELYNTGGAAGGGATGTGQLADCGTAQQCAQQILDTPSITYDPGIQAEVEEVAATGAISGIPMSPKILQVILAISAEGIPLRLSSSVRPGDPGHHGQGRAFDIGNEEVAGQLMPFVYSNREQFMIDELIYSNPPAGTANLNGGVDHQYNSGTIQQHADHIHISVK